MSRTVSNFLGVGVADWSLAQAWQTLGVPAGSDLVRVNRAYHRLARQIHPDVSADPDAADRFDRLTAAYRRAAAAAAAPVPSPDASSADAPAYRPQPIRVSSAVAPTQVFALPVVLSVNLGRSRSILRAGPVHVDRHPGGWGEHD